MTDKDIARRLAQLDAVYTPAQRIRNDIIAVEADAVVVCSERTDVHRRVPFRDIRNADNVTTNGVVARALKAAIESHGGDTPLASRGDANDHPSACWAPSKPRPHGRPNPGGMVEWFTAAKAWVAANTDWVESVRWDRDPALLTPAEFLAEYAWAVYVSGFKAGTVSVKWTALSKAWKQFNPGAIGEAERAAARQFINHESKTGAIVTVAKMIASSGWPEFRATYLVDTESIAWLPWMGPANRRFLARNLRIADVGKPDRWLVRFAEYFGYADVDEALGVICDEVGDPPGLADAYIWAYLAENPTALD